MILTFDNNLSASFYMGCLSRRGNCSICATVTGANNFSGRRLTGVRGHTITLNTIQRTALSVRRRCCRGDVGCVIFNSVLHGNACPVSIDSRHVFRTVTVVRCTGSVNTSYITRNSAKTNGSRIHFSLAFRILTPRVRVVAPAHSVALAHRCRVSCLGGRNFRTSFGGVRCSVGGKL